MSVVDDEVLLKALALIGEEALPLAPIDEYPDERTYLRHRIVLTLVRLSRLTLLGADAQTLANDFDLARRRLERLVGGPLPAALREKDSPTGPLPCLNCDSEATEERDHGIPVCAACGEAWDRGHWGWELR